MEEEGGLTSNLRFNRIFSLRFCIEFCGSYSKLDSKNFQKMFLNFKTTNNRHLSTATFLVLILQILVVRIFDRISARTIQNS